MASIQNSSSFPVASRDVSKKSVTAGFPAMAMTPEQMQMAAMYAQMMQMQQQMEQMRLMQFGSHHAPHQTPHQAPHHAPHQAPHTRAPRRVLNAPKPVGRSGLVSSRPKRAPRVAPAENETLRPYAFACHQFYGKLVRAADGAFFNMPEDATSNLVKGIRLDDLYKCKKVDGTDCMISVADILYGFREHGGHFTQRQRTHAAYHITNPFEAAQIYALSKGYYLANTSDPAKSLALHIEVFKVDPKQSVPLWHGQNIQPKDVALKVDLSVPDFEDVRCFYMQPIRDAARFVNSTFAQDAQSEADDAYSETDDAHSEVVSDAE